MDTYFLCIHYLIIYYVARSSILLRYYVNTTMNVTGYIIAFTVMFDSLYIHYMVLLIYCICI